MRACVCARTCVHEYNMMWVSNVPGTYSSSGAHVLSVTFCKEHFGMLCTAEKLCLIQKLLQSVQDFVGAYRGTGRHTDPKVVCAVFVMCGVLDIHSPCRSSVEVWSFIVFHSSPVIHYARTYIHTFLRRKSSWPCVGLGLAGSVPTSALSCSKWDGIVYQCAYAIGWTQ